MIIPHNGCLILIKSKLNIISPTKNRFVGYCESLRLNITISTPFSFPFSSIQRRVTPLESPWTKRPTCTSQLYCYHDVPILSNVLLLSVCPTPPIFGLVAARREFMSKIWTDCGLLSFELLLLLRLSLLLYIYNEKGFLLLGWRAFTAIQSTQHKLQRRFWSPSRARHFYNLLYSWGGDDFCPQLISNGYGQGITVLVSINI